MTLSFSKKNPQTSPERSDDADPPSPSASDLSRLQSRQERLDAREAALSAYEAELTARQKALEVREAAVAAKEAAAGPLDTFEASASETNASETNAPETTSTHVAQQIVDSVPLAIMVKDRDGAYCYVNREVCGLLGRPASEILGKTDVDLFGPRAGTIIREREQIVYDEGTSVLYEETLHIKGESHYFETLRVPWTDASGDIIGTIGMCWDTTKEARDGQLHTTADTTFRTIIDEARDSIYVLDRDGRFVTANASTGAMLKRKADTLVGTSIGDVVAPGRGDPAAVRARLDAAFNGTPQRFELWVQRADGTTFPKDVRLQRGEFFGEPVVIGIGRDVTQRYEREQALRVSESKLKQAQRIAHLGYWEWEVRTGRIDWSDETFRIFGYPPQSFEPSLHVYMEAMPPEDQVRIADATQAALQTGHMATVEHRVLRPDGTERIVEIHGQTLEDQDGRPVRVAGTIHDVTERTRQKELLRRAKEEAEEAARLKSAMLANMSHEVRTPLTSIIGFSEVIEAEGDPSVAQFARLIHRSSIRLKNTLDSVLQLAKLEAGRRVMRRDPFDLVRHVRHVVETETKQARDAGVHLTMDTVAEHCPCVGDAIAAQRIVGNLVSNAVKFTPKGGRVEVRVAAHTDGVLVEVDDTGIGMGEAFQTQMFEAFTQESVGRRRQHEGSGLGLAIVKQIAELLGGSLEVESTPGHGTRIAVLLPRTHRAA